MHNTETLLYSTPRQTKPGLKQVVSTRNHLYSRSHECSRGMAAVGIVAIIAVASFLGDVTHNKSPQRVGVNSTI